MGRVFTVGRHPIYTKEELRKRIRIAANKKYHLDHPDSQYLKDLNFKHHWHHPRDENGNCIYLTEEEKKQQRRDYNQKNKDSINAKRRENPNKKEYNKNYRATHIRNKLSDKKYNSSEKGKVTRKTYREERRHLNGN